MNNNDLSKHLNHLLERTYDAEKGYKQVAEKVEHTELKSLMEANAQNRYRFGHELKDMLTSLGTKPDKGTSIEGDAHRAWISVKDVLSMNSDKAILEEAIRGENTAIDAYQEVLEQPDLGGTQRDVLQKQMQEIKQSTAQLERLKETV